MISEKMMNALNEQIKHEMQSAYLYFSMATYFETESWDGMANWMRMQADEEWAHSMRMYHHIMERDGKVKLNTLTAPQAEWASPLKAFKAAYKHEQFITSKIYELATLAREESDFAAEAMLQWFVNEQVEEEANAAKIVQMLERVGDNMNGMLMIDRQLGERVASAPAATEE